MVQQTREGSLVPIPQIKNLAGVIYPVVGSFKYLGVIHVPFQRSLSVGGCSNLDSIYDLEVARRLQVARLKFYNFRYFLLDKGTSSSIKFKVEIFKVQVLTVLLSCSGVCVFSDKNIKSLESFYYQSLRKICGYRRHDHTPKIVVYEKCGVLSLEVLLNKCRVLWAIRLHNFDNMNPAKMLSYNNRASDGSVRIHRNQRGDLWDSVLNLGHLGTVHNPGSFPQMLLKTLGHEGLRVINAVSNHCPVNIECAGDPIRWGNVPVDQMMYMLPPEFVLDEQKKNGVKDLCRVAVESYMYWVEEYLKSHKALDSEMIVEMRNQSVNEQADAFERKVNELRKSEKEKRKEQREISEQRNLSDKAVITNFYGNMSIDEWAGTVFDQIDIFKMRMVRKHPDIPLEFISISMESSTKGSKTLMRKFSFPSKHVLQQIVQRGKWKCGSFVEGLFVQDGMDVWYIGIILSFAQTTETCCILFADLQIHFDFPLKDLRDIALDFKYAYEDYPSGKICMAVTKKGISCKNKRVSAGIFPLPVCMTHFVWFLEEKVKISLE